MTACEKIREIINDVLAVLHSREQHVELMLQKHEAPTLPLLADAAELRQAIFKLKLVEKLVEEVCSKHDVNVDLEKLQREVEKWMQSTYRRVP